MKKIQKTALALLATTTLLSAHGQEWWMFPFFTTYAPTAYSTYLSTPSNSKKYQPSKSLQFIMDNREVLEVEVAKGEGETLDTLATLYELKEEDQEAWKLKLQENHEQIFHPGGYSAEGVASNEYVDYMVRSFSVPVE